MKISAFLLFIIIVVLSISSVSFSALFTPSNVSQSSVKEIQAQQMNFFLTDNNQQVFN